MLTRAAQNMKAGFGSVSESERRLLRVTTYLDHAATTTVRPEVADALMSALEVAGNPSSLHSSGRAARRVLEESRESIAADLGAHPTEVILTSGGTESDNLAIQGIWRARQAEGRSGLVISTIEHHAVLETAHWLADNAGASLYEAEVDSDGLIDIDRFESLLQASGDSLSLASIMWANNEVGTIEPIGKICELAHQRGVLVHSDAVQAVGQIPVNFAASTLDALSLSGHKIGAPVGIGALLLKRDVTPVPVLHGGGQERAIRSGTLPHPLFAALAAALRCATEDLERQAAHKRQLRDRVIEQVLTRIPGAKLQGATGDGRLPGNAHFTFENVDSDALLFTLDAAGVCASSGSACQAGVQQPSHVVLAMGGSEAEARSALRISLGWDTEQADIDALLAILPEAVERARAAYRPSRRASSTHAGTHLHDNQHNRLKQEAS